MLDEQWEVFVSFPYTDMIADTKKVCDIVGKEYVDAGTFVGSGMRDVTWSFATKDEANEASAKLQAAGYTPEVWEPGA